MLTLTPSPPILSAACREYSARLDLARYDAEKTPREFGLELPAFLNRAVPKRQAEYLAGRFAARAALLAAGCKDPGQVGVHEDLSPVWPAGFVGSITHCAGFVAAVAAPSPQVRAIGRDTEVPLDDAGARGINAQILRPEELLRQPGSGLTPGLYTTLLFSAKESLYKALAPRVRKYFDFQDAEALDLRPGEGRLRLRLKRDLTEEFKAGMEFPARFAIGEWVHSSVEL